MSRRRNKQLILGFLTVVALVVVVGGSWKLIHSKVNSGSTAKPSPTATIPVANPISDRISYGDRIFINYSDESKEFQTLKNNKDFQQARNNLKFRQQGSEFCADPEPLIYLNNAQIGKKESYKIAVVVPIENQQVAALEILRGVAQAQDDINKSVTKINGKFLKVIIANEIEGNTNITEGIANYLVEDKDILGVIGHFTSDDTEKAVPIYGKPDLKEKRLVLISSTSTKPKIDDQTRYFFRTVPNNIDEAEKLAEYMFTKLYQPKPAIVFNSGSTYSRSLQEEFKKVVRTRTGKEPPIYDLKKGLNGSQIIKESIKNQTNVFLFAGNKSSIKETIFNFLNPQAQKFHYLAGDAMYEPSSLTGNPDIGRRLRNMVIAVPWHYTVPYPKSQDFVKNSYQLWCQPQRNENKITWRTATSYDATNALIEAIKKNPNPSRETIQEVLSNNFSMQDEGVTGKIRFKNNGDFDGESKLVQLVEKEAGTLYEFQLLPDQLTPIPSP
ncbi:MAG: ABC transporter substrate-binding protein [Tolypothrix brevis GSE-NOS-MK-07-07A]|jgi:branched-chain amino acid transport system substrate-binding protein|nr:ABC transporter substrate-binding protein [Tolypothrix brevis GSE-NOS-MK-07-07A]